MTSEPEITPAKQTTPAWWEVLLKDGESSSQETIEQLRLFVHRAIRRSIGGRRESDFAFIEDVTQEATLRLLKCLDTFRGDCQFTTWATTVAVRVAFTELRHRRWKEVSLDQLLSRDGENAGSRYEPVTNPEVAANNQQREQLVASLQEVMQRVLSQRQLTAINAELAGIPIHQLAEKLQTNPNALYKLLHDARKKLKQGLADMGISEQDVRIAMGM
jgi:RNA polymerase sigma-70 factor (ECF subfamily)